MNTQLSRRAFLGTASLGLAAALAAPAARAAAAQPASPKGFGLAKRVVLLSLDGIRADGYRTARTPNLDRLFARGVFSLTTRDVMPTVTLPNWTTILTGYTPEQHGIQDNNWTAASDAPATIDRDAQGYIPSVFTALKRQVPDIKTAFYWNWQALVNPYNPADFDETAFEANDGYRENCAKALAFLKANRDNPALVFLYDVHTDHAGHNHSWMSPAYLTAIEESDAAFGVFLRGLAEAGLLADTHFLFLSDHGGHGTGHGSDIPEDRIVPWGLVGPGIRKGHVLRDNHTVNTSPVLMRLFGAAETPAQWTGTVPEELFV